MIRASLLALCLCAAPAAQAAQIYVCRITDHGNTGWIPEVLFLGREDGADTATVSDPLILYFNDRTPLTARVVADNPRRVTFVWSVPATTRAGQYVRRLQFTATYLKFDGKMIVAASPLGYSNLFSGAGTCEVSER